MKKEKIAKLKITKHIRKKKAANKRGAPAKRVQGTRLGRKIIIRYICRDKKGNKSYFKYTVSIYSKLFCVKQP